MKYLEKTDSNDVGRGKTVKEISKGVDEDPSVVRVDLEALKAEGVQHDTKRSPHVYWIER